MNEWRARMEQRRAAMANEKVAQFEQQKAERAKFEDEKAENSRQDEEIADQILPGPQREPRTPNLIVPHLVFG